MGHSWGSVLAEYYIRKNSLDVTCYIGTGQVIDMMKNEKTGYDKLRQLIEESGDPKHVKEFSKYEGYPYSISKDNLLKTLLSFRKLQGKYGLTGDGKKQVKVFTKSPVFHISDIYPMLRALKINRNLFDTMFLYSIYDDAAYKLPVYFICGRDDYQTPSILVEEYYEKVQAPRKGLYWVENAGHLASLDNPEGYNDALVKIIEEYRTNI